jgi:FdhD protein
VAGRAVAITMRTPGHDEELAAGFCLTEGIIAEPDELAMVEPCEEADYGNIVTVELVSEAMQRNAERIACATREVYMSSSCGLCGKQSIDRIRQQVPAIRGDFTVSAAALQRWPDVMRSAQATFDATGGLHAAGLITAGGDLMCVREDVGRHNAVDKVVGWAAREGRLPATGHVLMVSGRASFELVQKATLAGVPMLAAVSAPSTLAVDLAVESGLTLVGFLRGRAFNIYTGEHRVLRPPR